MQWSSSTDACNKIESRDPAMNGIQKEYKRNGTQFTQLYVSNGEFETFSGHVSTGFLATSMAFWPKFLFVFWSCTAAMMLISLISQVAASISLLHVNPSRGATRTTINPQSAKHSAHTGTRVPVCHGIVRQLRHLSPHLYHDPYGLEKRDLLPTPR